MKCLLERINVDDNYVKNNTKEPYITKS